MGHPEGMTQPEARFVESLRLWGRKAGFMLRFVAQVARRGSGQIAARRSATVARDFDDIIEALQSGQTLGLCEALIGASDPYGQPWVFHAIDVGSVAAVAWFCARDCLPATDRGGRSLMQAAIERSLAVDEFDDAAEDPLPMIDALVAQGVDVNGADAKGLRPLHIAASLGAVAAAHRLIVLGADPALRDGLGLTAKDYAMRLGQADLVAVLRGALKG